MFGKRYLAIGVIVLIAAAVIIFASIGFYSQDAMEELPSMAETMPSPPMEAPVEEAEMAAVERPPLAEPQPGAVPQPNGGAPTNGTKEDQPRMSGGGSFTPFGATISVLPGVLMEGVKDGSEMSDPPAGSDMPDFSAPPATRNGADGSGLLDSYKVELGVDAQLQKPGPAGELKVWIGDPELGAHFGAGVTTVETTVPAIGQSARVTPVAPNFEVSPAESICMKIHPSGSEARFTIKPKATGTFKVSADVFLYESDVCMGSPVQKSPERLTVKVTVNKKGVAIGYLQQLWDILWQGILDFWQWLVAAIAGLFVFLIRKRLKKLFGYDASNLG